jgi:hypothetical protein
VLTSATLMAVLGKYCIPDMPISVWLPVCDNDS